MKRSTRIPRWITTLAAIMPLLVACGERPGWASGAPDIGSDAAVSVAPGSDLPYSPQVPSTPGRAGTESRDSDLTASRETAVVRASERIAPAVVAVNVLRTQQIRTRDPFWDDFFPFGSLGGRTTQQLVPSLGSGFVIDESGIVLTNDHVVRGAERILVTFPDGTDAEAELVGTDEVADVAVLQVDREDLPTVPIGRTTDLRIGEWVIAFGNPFGSMISNPEPTVTVGVVSAVGRHIVPSQEDRGFYLGMIQTDAAINPGNSGGPLVNAAGEVVGMNASIFSRSGGSEGMGFAIPIERALRIADDLVAHGEVRRAWLGLEVEPEAADPFGRTRGVRVARVVPGSPAARAGIREGTRLLTLRGVRLVSPLDFEAVLLDLRAGDQVGLTLDDVSGETSLLAEEFPSLRAERIRVFEDLELVSVSEGIRSERGLSADQGALVTGISPQLQSILGLREGDVILGLNNRGIRSAEDLSELLRQVPAGTRLRLHIERNQGYLTQDFILGR
ncbi:MAG: trypsin-like peptidase domain-containing protein [Gemmatimonadota bacterium]